LTVDEEIKVLKDCNKALGKLSEAVDKLTRIHELSSKTLENDKLSAVFALERIQKYSTI
jgi:hypothetical protein